MNDAVTRSTVARPFAGSRPYGEQPVPARPVVFLRQVSPEHWIVRDGHDLRGGTFRDLKSAQKFIRRDFAPATTIVVQPRFVTATSNTR